MLGLCEFMIMIDYVLSVLCLVVLFFLPYFNPYLLNVAIHNLPHFRVSSKHVAGSISEGVMCLTLMLCRCLSRFGPKRGS